MIVTLHLTSKEASMMRCLKDVEVESIPEKGQNFNLPVGQDGKVVSLTVRSIIAPVVYLDYDEDRLSLDSLIADGWAEGVFIWPA